MGGKRATALGLLCMEMVLIIAVHLHAEEAQGRGTIKRDGESQQKHRNIQLILW